MTKSPDQPQIPGGDLLGAAKMLHMLVSGFTPRLDEPPDVIDTLKKTLALSGYIIDQEEKRRAKRDAGKRADLLTAEERAREIGRLIDSAMPQGWGFFLILASFGEDGFLTYLSSVQRECIGSMLLELLEKWKKDPELWDNVTKEYEKTKKRNQKA